MLFKEKLTITESGFEAHKDVFNKIIDATLSDLEKNCINIGDGKTAEVKILKEKNSICLKIVDSLKAKKNEVFLKNNVNEEIEFLDKLSDTNFLDSIGITKKMAPQPMFSRQDSRYGSLFLERIKGFTIEDLLKDNLFDKLPNGFDWNVYFSKLEDIVSKLNKAKIFHRDFHEGNIFIDETGEPIIIDFGDAYESFLADEDPYREELPDGNTIIYKSDMENLKEIKEKIFEIINNR
ncbi:MAG: phosphotransferase [bacterium]|nr:phosphotransferase [bacterium]